MLASLVVVLARRLRVLAILVVVLARRLWVLASLEWYWLGGSGC